MSMEGRSDGGEKRNEKYFDGRRKRDGMIKGEVMSGDDLKGGEFNRKGNC